MGKVTEIVLKPMGNGAYAILRLDSTSAGCCQIAPYNSFQNLNELQERLKSCNVPANQIPQEDFNDARQLTGLSEQTINCCGIHSSL